MLSTMRNPANAAARTPPRRDGVQAIARAGAVLRALAAAPAGLSLAELSDQVRLPKSTVHRLVGALAEEDLVSTTGGRVELGTGLARLRSGVPSVPELLRPVLEALSSTVRETVDLAVLDGPGVRFVDQIPGPGRLTALSAVGDHFPLHCTANGKALLAALGEPRALELLPARLERFTPNTITSRRALLTELALVRADGVAFDREEHTEGICAIGAAVPGAGEPLAALSIPVPASRFRAGEARYARALHRAREQASELLSRSARA
jgi:DNA-binding IclR family transcriptional regulator